jgi:hypothetical protein
MAFHDADNAIHGGPGHGGLSVGIVRGHSKQKDACGKWCSNREIAEPSATAVDEALRRRMRTLSIDLLQ